MKLIHTLTFAAALAAASGAALAGDGHHRGDGRFGGERLARMLDLSDEQTAQVRDIVQSHVTELKTLHQQIRDLRGELKAQDGTFDEAQTRSRADKLGDLMGDTVFLRSRMESRIHAVLTPEQRQELAEKRERFEERRHHGRDDD